MKNETSGKRFRIGRAVALACLGALSVAVPSWAASGDVGSIVTIRGAGVIHRSGTNITADRKSGVQLKDVVETADGARMKMLFIDESMLTLGPKSKASIEEFVYSKQGGGASIFNLLDGKMRTIVGKTAFVVHTATSVAAARGTVIDFVTGFSRGKPFTRIHCLEGRVDVSSPNPNIPGLVQLQAGHMITLFGDAPLPKPIIAPADAGHTGDAEGGSEGETGGEVDDGTGVETYNAPEVVTGDTTTTLPPVEQQPAAKTTPVKINVKFP